MVNTVNIVPSAIYLFVVKNPNVTTDAICHHFRADFSRIMPQLEQMKQNGTLDQNYAYPGRMSLWSAKR